MEAGLPGGEGTDIQGGAGKTARSQREGAGGNRPRMLWIPAASCVAGADSASHSGTLFPGQFEDPVEKTPFPDLPQVSTHV